MGTTTGDLGKNDYVIFNCFIKTVRVTQLLLVHDNWIPR